MILEKDNKDQTTATNQTWLKSPSKCIYFVNETDVRSGENTDIGYCRTRSEADHLIYDFGMKKYEEHKAHRDEKKKYNVTYSYIVDDDSTRFEIKEKSLGWFYDGVKVVRYIIKFNKLYRSYNNTMTPAELESNKKTTELKDD